MGANTNAGSKFYACAVPQPIDLDQTAFAALTYVEVMGTGSLGETGAKANILTYDDWGTDVAQKSKGITNAGDPELETRRIYNDAGQIVMRTIGATRYSYAFKVVKNDIPEPGGSPTTTYHRGIVTGPYSKNGRNEDWDLENYTLGLVQRPVIVNAADAP